MGEIPAARLASLIRMLGSSSDGEILATVAALRRALAATGSDLHALAEQLSNGSKIPQADMQRLYDAGYQNGYLAGVAKITAQMAAAAAEPEAFHQVGAVSWAEIAHYCADREPSLREREKDFIVDMAVRRRPLTERQAAWLAAIYRRLGGDPSKLPEE